MQFQKNNTGDKNSSGILKDFQNTLKSKHSMPRHKKSFYVFYVIAAIVIIALSIGL
ncbi:MAG: hypothetical protein P8X83_04695 [Nitrosopumilaceae archaeon]